VEEKLLYQDIARALIEAARRHKFLPEVMPVAPELSECEKALMLLLAGKIKEFSSLRAEASLDQDEIQSLFTYVYARSAEAVISWLGNSPFMPNPEGMFSGNTPFQAEEDLIKLLKARHLADCMYAAFADWCDRNPDFCSSNGIHPVLPLLEALKWTFRFGTAIVIEFFEKKPKRPGFHSGCDCDGDCDGGDDDDDDGGRDCDCRGH